MEITTRYSLNQAVWFMLENKPVEKIVYGILIEPIRDSSYPVIRYEVGKYSTKQMIEHTFLQSILYPTKEELLKSL